MADNTSPKIKALFDKLNKNEVDENGNSVCWASLHPEEFIAEVLALSKSEFDWRNDTCYGLDIPSFIISTGDVLLADKFIKATKLNLNERNPDGTPLFHAARAPKMIKYLIAMGANPNTTDQYGSLLTKVCAAGHVELAQLLIENGARLDITDQDGATVAHAAAMSGELDILKYLVSQGCDMTKKDKNGETPLYYAQHYTGDYYNHECVEYLRSVNKKKSASKKKSSTKKTTRRKGGLKKALSTSSNQTQTEQVQDEVMQSSDSVLATLDSSAEKFSERQAVISSGKEMA